MKKVLLALSVLLISVGAFSQERKPGSELSIGVQGGLPVGSLHDTHNGMVGGDLKYAYNFDEAIAVTLQSGYNNFFGKTVAETNLGNIKYRNFGIVPIKAGVRFSMGPLYAEPQIGAAIFTGAGDGTALTYAGNIGVLAGQNFDISLKYEGWSKKQATLFGDGDNKNFGYLGLRLAYNLPL